MLKHRANRCPHAGDHETNRQEVSCRFSYVESAAQSMNRMRQDLVFMKRIYEDNSQNPMWSYVVEFFVERYTRRTKEKLGADTLDTQLLYSIRLYCYGAVGMTREWLLKDNITPANTVVQMMFHSMPDALRAVYFR